MNQEQLNAIKERVAKATPGPWESEETVEGHIDIFNPNEDYAVCQTGNETYDCLNDGDTEFIKHSITDVPALVAEVERLREALSIYADEKRWVEPCIYTALVNGEPETVKDAPWAILDCGDYARQALGGETK